MDSELIVLDILTEEEGPPYRVSLVTDESRSKHNLTLGTLTLTLQVKVATSDEVTRKAYEAELATRRGPPEPILEVLTWDRYSRTDEKGERVPCLVRLIPGVF